MDRQAIFDRVTTHLLTQNTKALNENGCAYLADDGTQCAVGCLIDKEHYDPRIEGGSPTGHTGPCYAVRTALENSLGERLTQSDLELLRDLQEVHDDNEPWEWAQRLEDVSYRYGLTFNPPTQAA